MHVSTEPQKELAVRPVREAGVDTARNTLEHAGSWSLSDGIPVDCELDCIVEVPKIPARAQSHSGHPLDGNIHSMLGYLRCKVDHPDMADTHLEPEDAIHQERANLAGTPKSKDQSQTSNADPNLALALAGAGLASQRNIPRETATE